MNTELHDHLTHDHGRARHEIAGLPFAAVHRLEHFDQNLGLLHLNHRHPTEDPTGAVVPSGAE